MVNTNLNTEVAVIDFEALAEVGGGIDINGF